MTQSVHETAAKGFEVVGDTYERGRPTYPQDAVSFLSTELGIAPNKTVIDLGAGTGKFTKLIASSGARIIAVEPVEGMRKIVSTLLPQISILAGTAEHIPLPDQSADAVIVAQAFHWFDGPKALAEISRVLKRGGKLGLIWNASDESQDWVSKLIEITDPHKGGTPQYPTCAWKEAFESNLFSPLIEKHFKYVQKGDPGMVEDRVASISFIAALDSATKAQVIRQVKELLANHPDTKDRKEIEFSYRTDVFICSKTYDSN